jgi:hypothetical protein
VPRVAILVLYGVSVEPTMVTHDGDGDGGGGGSSGSGDMFVVVRVYCYIGGILWTRLRILREG